MRVRPLRLSACHIMLLYWLQVDGGVNIAGKMSNHSFLPESN